MNRPRRQLTTPRPPRSRHCMSVALAALGSLCCSEQPAPRGLGRVPTAQAGASYGAYLPLVGAHFPGSGVSQQACVRQLSRSLVPLTLGANGKPLPSRQALDLLERERANQHLPGLAQLSLPTHDPAQARQIQRLREQRWPRVCGLRPRFVEFVVSESVRQRVAHTPAFGGDLAQLLNAYIAELNRVVQSAPVAVGRVFVLDRIVVVADAVVSGPQSGCNTAQGWQVCNDKAFSLWANDRLNGVPGDIPYDIDSRWVLNDHWVDEVLNWSVEAPHPLTGQHVAMDYALLHELLHHLCMGDLYWYNPQRFQLGQSAGRVLRFNRSVLNENDAMWNPSAASLSALSALASRYCMAQNPALQRSSQDAMGLLALQSLPYVDPYTRSPATTRIQLDYGPLAGKVTDCWVGHPQDGDDAGVKQIVASDRFTAHSGPERCEVTLGGPDYANALWPVFYIVLELPHQQLGLTSAATLRFPVAVQRVLLNALVWGAPELSGQEATLTAALQGPALETLRTLAQRLDARPPDTLLGIGDAYSPGSDYRVLAERFPLTTERVATERVLLTATVPGSGGGIYWALKLP